MQTLLKLRLREPLTVEYAAMNSSGGSPNHPLLFDLTVSARLRVSEHHETEPRILIWNTQIHCRGHTSRHHSLRSEPVGCSPHPHVNVFTF